MVRRMWQGVTRCPFPVACSLLAARCLLPGARSFERRRSARFPLAVARGPMPGGPPGEGREGGARADPEVEATLAGLGSVAVAVGSRGIAEVAVVVRTLVAGLRRRGRGGFPGPAGGSNG